MINFIVKFLSSCAFLGYIPFASGTFGTMAGVLMVWLSYQFIDINVASGKFLYSLICVVSVLASIPICTKAEVLHNKKDSSKIVLDEAVSFLITMFLIPFNYKTVIAGFLLNRVLDIIKPEPAKYFQKHIPAGAGVVLDDVASSIYSNILLRTIIFLTGKFFFF